MIIEYGVKIIKNCGGAKYFFASFEKKMNDSCLRFLPSHGLNFCFEVGTVVIKNKKQKVQAWFGGITAIGKLGFKGLSPANSEEKVDFNWILEVQN